MDEIIAEIENELGRQLTPFELVVTLRGHAELYAVQRDELRRACGEALELLDACKAARAWLGERRSEDWPYDQVVNKLIDQLETAIKKAQ